MSLSVANWTFKIIYSSNYGFTLLTTPIPHTLVTIAVLLFAWTKFMESVFHVVRDYTLVLFLLFLFMFFTS
jgi:hypothetical protein